MIVFRTNTVGFYLAGNDNPGTMESEIAAYEERAARAAEQAEAHREFAALLAEEWSSDQ